MSVRSRGDHAPRRTSSCGFLLARSCCPFCCRIHCFSMGFQSKCPFKQPTPQAVCVNRGRVGWLRLNTVVCIRSAAIDIPAPLSNSKQRQQPSSQHNYEPVHISTNSINMLLPPLVDDHTLQMKKMWLACQQVGSQSALQAALRAASQIQLCRTWDFQKKRKWFHQQLRKFKVHFMDAWIVVCVQRDRLLESSFDQLANKFSCLQEAQCVRT